MDTRIVFTGDSVTDASRDRNEKLLGEKSLGTGYVKKLFTLTYADHPQIKLEMINSGFGGAISKDLRDCVEDRILKYNPKYVFIMIGINDLERQTVMPEFYENYDKDNWIIPVEDYIDNLEYVVKTSIDNNIIPILVSPLFFGYDTYDDKKILNDFIKKGKELAAKYSIEYLDVMKHIDEYAKYRGFYRLSSDRIHPNFAEGRYIIAKYIYDSSIWQKIIKEND